MISMQICSISMSLQVGCYIDTTVHTYPILQVQVSSGFKLKLTNLWIAILVQGDFGLQDSTLIYVFSDILILIIKFSG